ncbi:MAG: hypothetical protein WCV84_02770 [Patescibacteria group bacterium]
MSLRECIEYLTRSQGHTHVFRLVTEQGRTIQGRLESRFTGTKLHTLRGSDQLLLRSIDEQSGLLYEFVKSQAAPIIAQPDAKIAHPPHLTLCIQEVGWDYDFLTETHGKLAALHRIGELNVERLSQAITEHQARIATLIVKRLGMPRLAKTVQELIRQCYADTPDFCRRYPGFGTKAVITPSTRPPALI